MTCVAVFGLGYVGSVTAACLSRDGHRVVGVDIDGEKVASINAGYAPVMEPGLEALIRQQVSQGNLRATMDAVAAVRSAEVVLVTVGTPAAADGRVETTNTERAAEEIGKALRGTQQRCLVVIRSTIMPNVLEERLAPLLERASDCALGTRIRLCNNPEFLREATAVADYSNPPLVLVGAASAEEAEQVFALYDNVPGHRIHTDTRTAAMVKYACNAFHALKVSFANEIGTLASAMGIQGREVMQILCQDTRLNIGPAYLQPGFAFGGSCLPKDVLALSRFAEQEDIQADLIHAILTSNDAHLQRTLAAIVRTGRKRIGLVGLSFKAGTDDLRESPQVILAESLVQQGFDLRIYDPAVNITRLIGSNRDYIECHLPDLSKLLVKHPDELLRHAELLVLATDVAEHLDCRGYRGTVLDLRGDLPLPRCR